LVFLYLSFVFTLIVLL